MCTCRQATKETEENIYTPKQESYVSTSSSTSEFEENSFTLQGKLKNDNNVRL